MYFEQAGRWDQQSDQMHISIPTGNARSPHDADMRVGVLEEE